MGVISASTGLNSGIDISGTISKLMAIDAKPVTALQTEDTTLTNQETAVSSLSALLLSVQDVTQTLGQATMWGSQSATSSDTAALTASVTGSAAQGTFQYTPVQLAQSQQILSSGFQSADTALGGGTLTFRYGKTVNQGVRLSDINGGQGFVPGEIRITDRSGASAVIDLSAAQNIDDVIQAINSGAPSGSGINVTASTNDGRIVLTDNTGGSGALQVQEVNGGTTAASLGLANIDSTASSGTNSVAGSDIFTLANNIQLGALNDGMGVQMNPFALGDISYTLHDGTQGTIDLSQLSGDSSVNDLVQQINSQASGKLRASLSANGLVVTDTTATSANAGKTFSIANSAGSSAASDLGLVQSTTAGSLTGTQVAGGLNTVLLQALNDGMGVQVNSSTMGDISYTLHDGTQGTIDLAGQTTLGGVIQQIDSQSGNKLQASISGTGLVITDATVNQKNAANTFSISDAPGSTAASDLGLVASTTAGAVTGGAILGGLQTVLLSDLNGGQGLGPLGYMQLTDGNGSSVNVNLSTAVTLQDVIGDINSQAQNAKVDITAKVNAAGDGIELVDTSGGAGPLTAANSGAPSGSGSDGLNTAMKLGLATATGPGSSSGGALNSGDLHLQSVSQNTLLSSLNGGAGVAPGTIQITETNHSMAVINVTSSMQTVGDVIAAINRNATGLHAAINATGDGIVLTDTAHGSGALSVSEGSSTTASDLHLLGTATTVNGTQVINGSMTRTITLKPTDTLTDLQNDINNLGGGLSAGIVTDGSSDPYRLSLTATQSGEAGNMIVDSSQIGGMSLEEITHGQDALLALGGGAPGTPGPRLVSSSTNTFSGVLSGVSMTIKQASGQPVSISVGNDGTNIAAALQTFVTNYNNFRSQLTTDTAYDTTTETGAVLSNDGAAMQLDMQLSQLLTSSFSGAPGTPGRGPVQSLADVGITVQSDGTLSFDQNQFNSAWTANPAAVQQMFTTKTTGVSNRFETLINQLAGANGSLLSSRTSALQQQISDNQSTIDQMNQRLSDEQNLLYTQYYNMDLTIGKMKNTQSLLSNLTLLAPDTGVSSSSSG